MTKRLHDELEAARGELAHAEKSAADAHHEYRAYVSQGDLQMAANAKRAIANAERSRDTLADRVEALESAVTEAEQASADDKLKKAVKRAEEAAEAERMAAAEVSDIAERMAVLLDRLKAASDESFRSTSAMIRAAAEAGTDAPVVRTPMSREGDPRDLLKYGKRLCIAFDQQEKSATDQTSRRRKAG